MDLGSHTVFITGGASGIGFALAQRFLSAGSDVIVCGRREEKLQEVKQKYPSLHIHACDVSQATNRVSLFEWVTQEFPKVNILVNNAGIQRRFQLMQNSSWEGIEEEIAINLEAPLHLSTLFIPHLLKQDRPAIINITSGLAFVPMANAPIYCATKAALRSFTLSLRHQLSATPISVVEIIPPAVNTDLGGKGLHSTATPLDEFADAVVEQLQKGSLEISYGFATQSSRASREELNETFKRMNQAAR
ncbi:MAG: SDR family NAD(P)-dependent oxidoreductase [Bacteroidota bacterium]